MKTCPACSAIVGESLVLYEIFTGKPVFEGSTFNELLRKHRTATPTTPSELVKEIDPLVEQALGGQKVFKGVETKVNNRCGSRH